MRKQLLIILIAILSNHCYSQITFEKGYYINNSKQRIECLIKNIDWMNNPTEFEFRLSEDSEQKKTNIKLVEEFGIYNYSKYIRSDVNIDRSSESVDDLSTTRNPVFKEEILFLKVLVEGKSILYQYVDGNLVRYFYNKDNAKNVEQLIFKNFQTTENLMGENNRFRQQLYSELKCDNITANDVKTISYKKDDLVKFFVVYNECSNSETVNFEEKQKRDLFNLNLRLGGNYSSLAAESKYRATDFGNEFGLRIGIEAEIILPFNKNKWAFIIEPTYQYFKSEKEVSNRRATVDYKSIELPIGLRYYFFLKNNSKLFINGSYILDFTNNSTIEDNWGGKLDITNSTNFGFGVGYKQNDKYSLELRYHTVRGLLHKYNSYSSSYKTLSVILGYTIF